jgi:TonB family protein
VLLCLFAGRSARANGPQGPTWSIVQSPSEAGPVTTAQVRTRSAADPTHAYQFTVRCSAGVNFRDGPPDAFRVGVKTFEEPAGGVPASRSLPWPKGAPRQLSVAYRVDNGPSHAAQLGYAADNGGAVFGLVWLKIPATRIALSGLFPGEEIDVPFDALSASDRATLAAACIPAGRENVLGIAAGIAPPTKTKTVGPKYPSTRQGRVQGQVLIEATIGPDGKVATTKVIRGLSAELDAAAVQAVEQWEYTPTVFDGVGLFVPMTVTVAFTVR